MKCTKKNTGVLKPLGNRNPKKAVGLAFPSGNLGFGSDRTRTSLGASR